MYTYIYIVSFGMKSKLGAVSTKTDYLEQKFCIGFKSGELEGQTLIEFQFQIQLNNFL